MLVTDPRSHLLPRAHGRRLLALEELAKNRRVDSLLEVLASEEVEASVRLRIAVVAALGDCADGRALPALVSVLRTDPLDEVRWHAARALGHLGRTDAVPALLEALEHGSTRLQVSAAVGLGEIRDAAAIDALASMQTSSKTVVRRYAAEALGKIDDPRVVPPLCAYLQDRKRGVRLDAALALARVGDERAIEPLELAVKRQRRPLKALMRSRLHDLRDRLLQASS